MGLRKVCAQTVHLPKLWSDATMAQLRGLIMAAEAHVAQLPALPRVDGNWVLLARCDGAGLHTGTGATAALLPRAGPPPIISPSWSRGPSKRTRAAHNVFGEHKRTRAAHDPFGVFANRLLGNIWRFHPCFTWKMLSISPVAPSGVNHATVPMSDRGAPRRRPAAPGRGVPAWRQNQLAGSRGREHHARHAGGCAHLVRPRAAAAVITYGRGALACHVISRPIPSTSYNHGEQLGVHAMRC